MKINLGDIVTMPLPTQWSPDVQANPLNFPFGPPNLAIPPDAVMNPQAAAPDFQQGSQGAQGPFPTIPPTTAIPGDFGYPGSGEDFGAYGGGGVPWPAGAGNPSDFGAGYGQGIPGGFFGQPGGGYSGAGPFPGGAPRGLPLGRNVNPWAPQPVLRDNMLPLPLQRSNPLVRPSKYRANKYDYALMRDAWFWHWVQMHGGLKSCCHIPELGAPIYDVDPAVEMPTTGQTFRKIFSAPPTSFQSGGEFTGIDVVLGSFRVPIGYDGVINRVVAQFSGSGFDDFSGNIIWRVQVGIRYPKDYGNITSTFGDYATAFLVPGTSIPLLSGQQVILIANVPSTSTIGLDGQISLGVFGWWWPRR